jgi:hypothetical protein
MDQYPSTAGLSPLNKKSEKAGLVVFLAFWFRKN